MTKNSISKIQKNKITFSHFNSTNCVKKKTMKKIAILLSIICLMSLVSCSSETTAPETTVPETTDGRIVFLDSQAISIAQNSSTVQNKIANFFGLKFFYAPDWGTCEVENMGDKYRIDLKGTISGYTDDYKTNFVYDKKFNVRVWVEYTGEIHPLNITVEQALY